MIKAILFDLDGVFADTEWIHRESLIKAFSHLYPDMMFEIAKCITFDGTTTADKINRALTALGVGPGHHTFPLVSSSINRHKQHLTTTLLDALPPDPKKTEMLHDLRRRGYRIGMGTNTRLENAHRVLKAMDIQDCFDMIYSAQDLGEPKPCPIVYAALMSFFDVSNLETIIVEDSSSGREAAYRSGAFVYEVTNAADLNYEELLDGISKADHRNPDGGEWQSIRRARLFSHQAADPRHGKADGRTGGGLSSDQ